jgi:signal transduction histidine kinase
MTLVEEGIPDYLAIAVAVTQKSDWKEALDSVMAVVRSVFMFDNLALYVAEEDSADLTEIVYARAVGRGQSAGAESSWGVDVANQVMARNEMIVVEPSAPAGKKSVASGRTPSRKGSGTNDIPLSSAKANDLAAAADSGGRKSNRLASPYLLGMPLRTADKVIGALVFVRFGGPAYTPSQIQRVQYIATQFSSLLERKTLREQITALQEARLVIALQEDFIATISHELRTPLGFIKGYSTTLLRQDTEWDETTRREFLTIIDEEADHLATLIENVLESARLQSNTMPISFQAVRLDAVIRDIALRSQARYTDMKIGLNFAVTPVVRADSVRLAQVLTNLFSNAAKYAPGAAISISLTQEGPVYRIRFSDKGPGISSEYLPHLFQRFYRVPGQTSTGSGLGLFICKKIIEVHGATIAVESHLGTGTTFIIDFPIESTNTSKGA